MFGWKHCRGLYYVETLFLACGNTEEVSWIAFNWDFLEWTDTNSLSAYVALNVPAVSKHCRSIGTGKRIFSVVEMQYCHRSLLFLYQASLVVAVLNNCFSIMQILGYYSNNLGYSYYNLFIKLWQPIMKNEIGACPLCVCIWSLIWKEIAQQNLNSLISSSQEDGVWGI